MKDSKGHGSDAHGAARKSIQLSPNDANPGAEATLRSFGYKDAGINRLRLLAGANVANAPAAHQSGVERAFPRPTVSADALKAIAGKDLTDRFKKTGVHAS